MVSSNDSGSFSPGPKIFGKKDGRSRPRAKLASVTVRGPPRKIPQRVNTFVFLTHAVLTKSTHLTQLNMFQCGVLTYVM